MKHRSRQTTQTTREDTEKSLRWLFAVLVPVIAAYWIMVRYSIAIPYQDDYRAVLGFQLEYEKLPPGRTRFLYLLAAQHNEYKYIVMHAILIADQALTHRLSFALLEGLGNFLLLPLLWLLWLAAFPQETSMVRRLQLFFPISLLFFGLNYWELTDFVVPSLQYLPCLLFGLLSLYLLTRRNNSGAVFAMAEVSAAISILSSGNGVLLGPLGLGYLLSQRRYRRAILWCTGLLIPLATLLYKFIPSTPASPERAIEWPMFYLAFTGSALVRITPMMLAGLAILGLFAYATKHHFYRENPCLYLLGMWILTTGLLVAYARTGLGMEGVVASRYRINSDLLLIVLYVYLAARYIRTFNGRLDKHWLYWAIVFVGALNCAYSDHMAASSLRSREVAIRDGLTHFQTVPGSSPMHVNAEYDATHVKEGDYEYRIMVDSIEKGIYLVPKS